MVVWQLFAAAFLREQTLGPLLFLIYINDLPNCLSHCQPRMYADDTHLTSASNNIECIDLYLNQDLILTEARFVNFSRASRVDRSARRKLELRIFL